MPVYSLRAPNGKTYEIEGPTGATEAQVRAEILRRDPSAAGSPQAQTATRVPQRKGIVDNINGVLATLNRNLIVGDELAAAGGMVTRTARDAMAGKAGRNPLEFLQNAGRNYGAALDQQNAMEDSFAAENPYGAAVARTAGQGALLIQTACQVL